VQRGLHGTAAAIRVLGEQQGTEVRELLPRLIEYVEKRDEVETPEMRETVQEDALNIIKIAESLDAINHVDPAIALTEGFRRRLSERLLASNIAGRGWSYWTDEQPRIELLPTAIAIRALASQGYDVQVAVQHLLAEVTKQQNQANASGSVDVSVRVLCLYVLAFGNDGKPLVDIDKLREPFYQLWSRLSPLLKNEDIEQNVEYERRFAHRYVRVPWQLYLIALTARLAPFRFASSAVQGRLKAIVAAASGERGFFYPHSGDKVSARTNAILFEVLTYVQGLWHNLHMKLIPGRIGDFLVNSRITAWFARGLAGVIVLVSLREWLWGGSASIADLAPNLVSAPVLILLSIRRAR